MRSHVQPRPLVALLAALALMPVLVVVGWSVPAGHSKYILVLAVCGIVAWLAVRARGVLIGMLVLAALDGLPFFDTNRGVTSHVTYVDLATFALVGLSVIWILADGRSRRPTPLARTVSACGLALVAWTLFTMVRSDAPFLKAFQFGSDFLGFGALLMVLPRVYLSPRELKALLVVLGAGVAVFSVGQILYVENIVQLTSLIHVTGTASTLGLTRIYAPMNDMLTCGVAAGIAAVALLRNRRVQLLALLLTALCITSLVVQLTRARWITLALSIVVVSVFLAAQGGRPIAAVLRKRLAVVVGALAAGVAAVTLLAPHALSGGAVAQRFLSIFTDIGSSNAATSNVAVRQQVAHSMLAVLGGKWPFGIGLVPPSVHYYLTLPQGSLRDTDVGVFNAIMTIGALGALLIYVPLVYVLIRTVRASRTQTVERPWLNYAGQIWLVATLTSSVTLVTLFSKGGVVISAAMVALMCQAYVSGEATVPAAAAPESEAAQADERRAPSPSRARPPLPAGAGHATALLPARPAYARPLTAAGGPAAYGTAFTELPRWAAPAYSPPQPSGPPARSRRLPRTASPGRRRPALRLPHLTWRRRRAAIPPLVVFAVTAGAAAAVALGLASSGSGPPATPALTLGADATVGTARLAYPAGWRLTTPAALNGLHPSASVTLTSTSRLAAGQMMIAQIGPSSSIPIQLIVAGGAASRTPQTVTLGSHQFLRLLAYQTAGESVYALPGASVSLVAVCKTTSDVFAAECEQVLASATVPPSPTGTTAVELAYAHGLSAAMTTLNQARGRLSRQLANATTSVSQGQAASALAQAHRSAAAAVSALNAGTAAAVNRDLAGALRAAANAYTALAQAAGNLNPSAYRAAERAVTTANQAIATALAALSAQGYSAR